MVVAVLDASSDGSAYEKFSNVFENTKRFDVKKKEFPEDPDGLLVTGSRHAVYDDRDWIEPLLDTIREFSHEVPVMGVCFGHQAIAEALGGKVRHMGKYEIGYRQVRLGESRIFEHLEPVEYPFSTHEDEVIELPEDFRKIAESDESIHGFEHLSDHIYGIQFHPEFDLEKVNEIIESKDLSSERKRNLRQEASEKAQERAERTRKALKDFEEIVQNVAAD